MARSESNTHGQGPLDPHPGSRSPQELHAAVEQHLDATLEAAAARAAARGVEILHAPVEVVALEAGRRREATPQELTAALEPQGFTAVRGESNRDVAHALEASYRSRRQVAAGAMAAQALELETEEQVDRTRWLVREIQRRTAELAALLEREEYHRAVRLGEASYGDA